MSVVVLPFMLLVVWALELVLVLNAVVDEEVEVDYQEWDEWEQWK